MDNDIEVQGTRERLESGISFIPEDRQLQAMIMDMNLTNNVIIGRQNIEKYKSSLGTVKTKNAIKESEKVISTFEVKTPGTSTLATALSGGNQQKFVVGRELEDNPNLLIASQPTRGIDIGAQALIWEKLRNSRDEGLSVLLISADLEELIGLSDRIIVFYQGKLVKELDAKNGAEEMKEIFIETLPPIHEAMTEMQKFKKAVAETIDKVRDLTDKRLEELKKKTYFSDKWLSFILDSISDIVIKTKGSFALKTHSVVLSDKDSKLSSRLEKSLIDSGYELPSADTLFSDEPQKALELLHILKKNGRVIEIQQGMWIHISLIDKLKNDLSKYFSTNKEMKVSDFKIITSTSRKSAIPLLEYSDNRSFTVREGDYRIKGEVID